MVGGVVGDEGKSSLGSATPIVLATSLRNIQHFPFS